MVASSILGPNGQPLERPAPKQYSGPVNPAYRGGAITRLTRDWLPTHRSGDLAIRENWDLLTARIRDLLRNEPVIRNARRSLCKYVVGPGIQTFADAKLNAEDLDDDYNDESDDLFEHWENEEADVERRLSWPEMQHLHFSQVCEVGESILLRCNDPSPDRTVPLCYQLLEGEQLDWTKEWPAGLNEDGSKRPRCVRGIEMDENNRPIAYWLYNANPWDMFNAGWTGISQRIPAERVMHTYLVERPSQHRGISWFGSNMQSNRDLDWYIGNELTAAALGSLLTIAIKRKHGAGTGVGFMAPGPDDDNFGNAVVKLGAGIICDIGSEDSVEQIESKRPNRDAAPFLKLIMMLQGMGIGMSYLRMTGDYSQSSYTSARGAHLDDQAFFVVLQEWFGRTCVRKVRQQHADVAAALGLLSISPKAYQKNRRNYQRFDLQAPGREQLDPEKETDAAIKRMDSGISTWKNECGARGYHWRRIAVQRAREMGYFKKLADKIGVPVEQFVNLRANPPLPPNIPNPKQMDDDEEFSGDAEGSFRTF